MRRVRELKIGPGADPEAEMGPLVTGPHLDRVSGLAGWFRSKIRHLSTAQLRSCTSPNGT
jgi:acyl-CoA reductase-like NAD-dependent aldehyde dehydrogenase